MVPEALIYSSCRYLLCTHLPVSNRTSPRQMCGGAHLPYCRHTQGSFTVWYEYSTQIWRKLAQNTEAWSMLCAPVATRPSIPLVGWTELRCVPMVLFCSWDNGINVPEEKGRCRRTSHLQEIKCIVQVWQLRGISCIISLFLSLFFLK